MNDIYEDNRVVATEMYHGRLLVVKHLGFHSFGDIPGNRWYTGYAQLLPTDGIDMDMTTDEFLYHDIQAPGGLTFSGELAEFPGKQMLGFDTNHPFMDNSRMDYTQVMERCREMADDIAGVSGVFHDL